MGKISKEFLQDIKDNHLDGTMNVLYQEKLSRIYYTGVIEDVNVEEETILVRNFGGSRVTIEVNPNINTRSTLRVYFNGTDEYKYHYQDFYMREHIKEKIVNNELSNELVEKIYNMLMEERSKHLENIMNKSHKALTKEELFEMLEKR